MLAYNPADVKPGWIAFFIVLGLVVATFLLWRNMNVQLRKINVPFQQEIRDAELNPPSEKEATTPSDGDPPHDR
ncbi:MAG: hypothetical protein QOI06_3481 [Nocardioidaceae bacterium]|jgi:hypothetical protein|nr:hypothetical protein [Nocardioidaceae bacterium]